MPRPPTPPGKVERGRLLSKALADGRRGARLSQENLARRSGVSVDVIRSIEQSVVSDPGFLTVADLAAAAALSLKEIAKKTRGAEVPGGVKR